MTADEFQKQFNVSRETLAGLTTYADLLKKWQNKINLVSPTTINDIWGRHFADSAQVFKYVDTPTDSIADIGAGAGFPGMILAIMGCTNVTLIESDQRKCLFLKEVARKTGANVTILNQRIERVEKKFDLVTARALADLSQLLEYVSIISNSGKALFLKGQNSKQELNQAQSKYEFAFETYQSITDSNASILKISDLNVSRET